MKAKKAMALILAGALCASVFTGCGINKNATAATMKNQTVTMGVANFLCRYEQAAMEDLYKMYLGGSGSTDNIWSKDLSGNGTTLEDSTKDQTMEELHEMYTLQQHMSDYNVEITDDDKAAIKEAAQKFISANSKEALDEMGATEDVVEEVLTLYTIRNKMKTAIEADADTNVSDEEANMRAYSMVSLDISEGSDNADANKKIADKMEAALKEDGATLDKVAQDNDQKVTTGTYDADNDTLDEDVKKALDGLKEGETSGLIETSDKAYFVRIDKDTDEEATKQNRTTIINQRKDDLYQEVLSGWQKDDNWKVDEKAIKKIEFKNSLTHQDPNASTESTTGTENAESTQ